MSKKIQKAFLWIISLEYIPSHKIRAARFDCRPKIFCLIKKKLKKKFHQKCYKCPTPGDSQAMGALCIVSLCLSQISSFLLDNPPPFVYSSVPHVCFDFEKRVFRLSSAPYWHLAFPAKLPSAAEIVAPLWRKLQAASVCCKSQPFGVDVVVVRHLIRK